MSTIGSREELAEIGERLAEYAEAWRKRTVVVGKDAHGKPLRAPSPLDGDAEIVDQVAVEIMFKAYAVGDWPQGVLTQGRVLVWASSIMTVAQHLEEQVADELGATINWLRSRALQLRGHATGLRPTGTYAVSGEMVAPDKAFEPARELEVDEDAETQKIRPLKPRAKPDVEE